jgi:hypothetical protein
MHLAHYLGLLHRSLANLHEAYREVGDAHRDEPDVRHSCQRLARQQDWFPKVREGLGRKKLQEIGERMIELRQTAPRKPSQPGALEKAVHAVTA